MSPALSAHPTNEELLGRAQAGDEDACEALFQCYIPLIKKIVEVDHGIISGDVADVVQQTRLRFFKYLQGVKHLAGFVRTAARSACRNHLRGARRRRQVLEQYALLHPPPQNAFRHLEEHLIHRLDVWASVKRIGARCAELVTVVVLHQMPQREYARERNMSQGTIGPAVVRCLRKLRTVLAENGYISRRSR